MNNEISYFTGVLGIYIRWCTWQRIGYLVVVGFFSGLMVVQTEIADALIRGEIGLTWQPWVATYSSVISFIIVSPFLIYSCELWPFGKAHVIKTTIKLALLYIPITLCFITIMLILRNSIHLMIDGTLFDSWDLIDRYIYEFPKALTIYLIFIFVTYTKINYDHSQREQLNAANLQNELHTIRMQTLRSQLQPHFLFNTLNLISSTVYQDADKADSIIARLGDLLRYSLASEQKPFVTFKEELQAMQSYLEISQLRFDERMALEIAISPATKLVLIPTMLLQPLLENAVKYGIEPSNEIGKIILESTLKNGLLEIKITNPLRQRTQQQESFGIGLQNTKDRLKLLYQEQASVSLESNHHDQITLTLILPAQYLENTHE
ncbi:sensor histidine kinase [Colwellia psychrerythraea]|uniref:Putative signal transduction histidine kinase n=1 Tax=Colwellia psychrerythraea TaxID=28229 RepID=A0A099KH84_COLPS|nr:histidine kinase [Colwellia psychrerythraea]KGJ90134.1 putative signal transduction histidine kinase [Colwellia psychrerythraea]